MIPTKFYKKISRKFQKLFFKEQYSLLITDKKTGKTIHLAPPQDRIWADPFPVEQNDSLYVFIEQQFRGKNGTLGYIVLDPISLFSEQDLSAQKKLSAVPPESLPVFHTILEKPYHLSFPHIIDENGTLYMIPESNESNKIDCLRCTSFPDSWEYECTLMENVCAVDTVIWKNDGTYYLLTNIAHTGESLNEKAYLFSSQTFPSTDWVSCTANPVITDTGCSRNAGAIRMGNGKIYRAAQDCKKEYGAAMTIYEITAVSLQGLSETPISRIEPPAGYWACGTHTYNETERFVVTDIKTRKPRFL